MVKEIEPSPGADTGEIIPFLSPMSKDFPKTIIEKGVNTVLSRFNSPLTWILCKSIPITNRFRLLGRDIAEEFIRDVKAIAKKYPSLCLRDKIKKHFSIKIIAAERAYEVKKSRKITAKRLEDTKQSILYFEEISDHTEKGLCEIIDTYFVDKESKDCILLSSIHKAKGREWESVMILDYGNFPWRFADSQPWEYEQEENLQYIAVTRAKKTLFLHYTDDEKFNEAIGFLSRNGLISQGNRKQAIMEWLDLGEDADWDYVNSIVEDEED